MTDCETPTMCWLCAGMFHAKPMPDGRSEMGLSSDHGVAYISSIVLAFELACDSFLVNAEPPGSSWECSGCLDPPKTLTCGAFASAAWARTHL